MFDSHNGPWLNLLGAVCLAFILAVVLHGA